MENNKILETISNEIISLNTESNIFEKDWNFYGSDPIREKSIYMMMEYLNNFDESINLPEVMLEPYGNVSLFWGSENGSFVLAFNDIKNRIEYSIVNKKTNFSGYGIVKNIEDVKDLLKKLC